MDTKTIGDILQLALRATFLISAPMLLAGLVVGVAVALFQAATQVNEVTLVFIPKMLATGLVMWVLGPWMFGQLNQLIQQITTLIAHIGGGA